MKNKKAVLDTIRDGIRAYRGRCALYCFDNDLIIDIAEFIAQSMFAKSDKRKIVVVVKDNSIRSKIYNKLFNENHDLYYDKCIKVYSYEFASNIHSFKFDFCIAIGLNNDFAFLNKLIWQNSFTLAIFTRRLNAEYQVRVGRQLHFLDTKDSEVAIHYDDIYSSVILKTIPVKLSDEHKEIYDKYNTFIQDSMSIFGGNLSDIDKCRSGDRINNISAATFRDQFARKNGWNEYLDTENNQWMSSVDANYNPNKLLARSLDFYKITKLREDLLTDNNAKLETIYKICQNEEGKGILIVSKRGEFANVIAKYLDEKGLMCGEYHDCIDDKEITGINGKKKVIKSQAQSTVYQNLYNTKGINILSIKSTSNPKLTVSCDVLIFTSAYCDDVIQFKSRFLNVEFNNVTKAYLIYCLDTKEEEKALKMPKYSNVKVINEIESNELFSVAQVDEI